MVSFRDRLRVSVRDRIRVWVSVRFWLGLGISYV